MNKEALFAYKVHDIDEERILVAVCDLEIVGKRFDSGKVSLFVDPDFYNEKSCGEKKIEEILNNRKLYIINAVGKNIVKLLVDKGFVSEEKVLVVNNVPYVQVVYI